MIRRLSMPVLLALVGLVAWPTHARAQDKLIGPALTYNFEESGKNAFFVSGLGWIPVKGPNIAFKPLVLTPRFTKYFTYDIWQVDADMLWDIPIASDTNVRPYIGMGVGLVHESFGDAFSDSTPLLNIDAGFRYKKPNWKYQILLELHYSSGIDYANTGVINFGVLFPFGKK